MEILLVVFGGVLAIVLGAYYLFVMREENAMLARLKPGHGPGRAFRPDVLRPEEALSSVGVLNAALKRGVRVSGPVQRLLDQAGVKMTVSVFLLLTACFAFLGYLLGMLVTRNPLLASVFALLGIGPYAYASWQRRKRMRKFEEQFPEAIDLVARALRAGHALPTGLSMAADELPAPVGVEFRILFDEQNFGLTLPDALRNFARRIPVLDARFFVTAVLTQREAGGNLSEVLDNLGAVIRERFKVKRQVRVLSAHGRMTGWVLGCLPPTLALALAIINPGHFTVLLGDPLGQRLLLAAVVFQILGVLTIRKLVDIEY